MHQMKGTIRKFLDITATLSAERNFERLLDRVLHWKRCPAPKPAAVSSISSPTTA